MPSRSSYSTWLTTSWTWVVRSTWGLTRCTRSPIPVRLGVKTSCPCACNRRRTWRKPCAPLHAPCTRTYVAIAPRLLAARAVVTLASRRAGQSSAAANPLAHAGPPLPPAVEAGHAPHRLPHRHEGRLSRLHAPAHELAATRDRAVERVEELAAVRPPRARTRQPPTGPAPGRWRPAASRGGRRRAGRPPARTSGPSAPGRSRGGPARRSRSRGARRRRRRGRPRSRGRRRCGRRRRVLRRRAGGRAEVRVGHLGAPAGRGHVEAQRRIVQPAHQRGDGGQRGVGLRPVWVGRHGHGALDEDQPLAPVGVDPDGFGRARRSRRRGGGRGSGGWRPSAGSRGGARAGRSAARRRRWRRPRPAPPRPRPPVWPESGSPRRSGR